MFDAMAAGRPVLINVAGWLGETIEGNKCGRYVDPERPAALVDTLEELAANKQLCQEMGRNSRALAEREFFPGDSHRAARKCSVAGSWMNHNGAIEGAVAFG